MRPLGDPIEITATASALTGPHLGLDRCFYGEVDPASEHAHFAKAYCAPGVAPFPQQVRLDDFGEELVAIIATGATLVVDDIRNEPRLADPAQRGSYLAAQIGAFVGIPLIKEGRLVAILSAHQSTARQWTHNDTALLEEVAERTWAAVERARAETALRESEEQFRAFVNASSDVVYRMSADWSEMCELTGQGFLADTPEPSGDWMERYILSEDRDKVRAAIHRAIGTKSMFELEHRVFQADGTPGWTHSRAVPILGAGGEIAEWFGAAKDVTLRKRAEAALRESEERFREFGENSSDALWIVDAETMRLEYLSPAFERIWGESRDAVMADIGRWAELVHPDDRERAREAMPRLLAGEPFLAEYRIVRPDGEVRWIRDAGFPIKVGSVVKRGGGIAQDVTDLRRSQAALRESEERFRQFGEASQDVLWIRDAETFQWEYLTPAFETIYGLDRETALRGDNFANWTNLIVAEDRARAVANLERVRYGEGKTFEYRIRRPSDGRVRWLRNTDFPMRDASGAVQRIGGVGHDITELKRTENALAAAEQRQRALIEGMPQLVWRAVDGGEWTWASPQWTEFTGQSETDSHGWGWLEALHPDDRDAARAAWSEAMDRGSLDAEYRVCHAEESGYR